MSKKLQSILLTTIIALASGQGIAIARGGTGIGIGGTGGMGNGIGIGIGGSAYASSGAQGYAFASGGDSISIGDQGTAAGLAKAGDAFVSGDKDSTLVASPGRAYSVSGDTLTVSQGPSIAYFGNQGSNVISIIERLNEKTDSPIARSSYWNRDRTPSKYSTNSPYKYFDFTRPRFLSRQDRPSFWYQDYIDNSPADFLSRVNTYDQDPSYFSKPWFSSFGYFPTAPQYDQILPKTTQSPRTSATLNNSSTQTETKNVPKPVTVTNFFENPTNTRKSSPQINQQANPPAPILSGTDTSKKSAGTIYSEPLTIIGGSSVFGQAGPAVRFYKESTPVPSGGLKEEKDRSGK